MYFDYTYILVIIGIVISAIASARVNSTFRKYSQYCSINRITAEQCALKILHNAGIFDVRIERIKGNLTDHYSPSEKILRLSDCVFGSTSIAAIGVAAHECGHAIQHKVGYLPLKLRSFSVPVANIGSKLSWPIILIGLIFGYLNIAKIGVFLFLFVVLFQLITLPVELDASKRAISVLNNSEMFGGEELKGAKKVLRAAAMTYVAALCSSILQLMRFILLTNRKR